MTVERTGTHRIADSLEECGGGQRLASGTDGLCELCYVAEARDNAPNLSGPHLGRAVCRRCGERFRHFIVRAKALETLLLESRQGNGRYAAIAADSTRTPPEGRLPKSVVPSEERILRGLVTLNAAWRSAIPARERARPLTVGFSRAELTGLYSSLRRYKRSRRLIAALVADNVLHPGSGPGEDWNSLAEQYTTEAPAALERNRGCDNYSLGDEAPNELLKLLSNCNTLSVDAAIILGGHLEDIHHLLFGERRQPAIS